MKLKQWCWEKAINSMTLIMPFIPGTTSEKNNIAWWKEAAKRAKELYGWVK